MVWDEGKLRFSFSEQWQIIKLDQYPLWLEQALPFQQSQQAQKAQDVIFLKQVKTKVAWLTNRVSVVALNSLTNQLPDVQIHYLPTEKS